jgi:hypothetical protein
VAEVDVELVDDGISVDFLGFWSKHFNSEAYAIARGLLLCSKFTTNKCGDQGPDICKSMDGTILREVL